MLIRPKLRTKRIQRPKRYLPRQTEPPQLDSMHIKNIKPMRKQTKLSLSLIVKILVGKLTYASSPRAIKITDPTARLKRRLKI